MLDGKMFLPDTGMPMRKIACMSSPLALAEPVPFTFADLEGEIVYAACIGAGATLGLPRTE